MSYFDTFWRGNTVVHKHCRKFLGCVDDNFLAKGIEEPSRVEVYKIPLDTALNNLLELTLL